MAPRDGDDPGVRRKVSQADVARHAGVSAGIVSSVINSRDYGSIRVSDTTRDRVWRSIRDLGYVPNIAARNLAGGSNQLIGVFTYLPLFPLESRDFYHEFLVGIEEGAEESGYNLLLVTGAKDADRQRSIYAGGVNNLQLADGSILLGTNEVSQEVGRLAEERYPFVFVGQREVPGHELSYVKGDYEQGTLDIVRAIVGHGHRRIAMTLRSGSTEPLPGRRAGFRTARDQLGLGEQNAPVVVVGSGPSDGLEPDLPDVAAVIAWARAEQITAIIAEDSAQAAELRVTAEQAGLRVPDDLSLVGLSGAPELPGVSDLTELLIPRREMGRESVRLLLRLLSRESAPPLRTTLTCGLRPGVTLGPAPS